MDRLRRVHNKLTAGIRGNGDVNGCGLSECPDLMDDPKKTKIPGSLREHT
jgi:hypothetical protein